MVTAAPLPPDEPERLRALKRYGVLDTEPEEGFDRLTRLAGRLFDAPIALVSLVDEDRQWVKSAHGIEAAETPRAGGFCAHAILGDGIMEVTDASRDVRFRDDPLVTGPPHVRYYAGAPLVTADGYKLGALCIVDTRERPSLSERDRAILSDLAAMVVDELELRRAIARAEVAARAAAAANEAKSAFLAAMSHELRTPLNGVLGFAQILLYDDSQPLTADQRESIDQILVSGRHLMALIDDVLDLSKIESGRLTVALDVVSPHKAFAEIEPVIAGLAERHQVRLEVAAWPDRPIRADFVRFKQVLLNLLSNAIKYNLAGGSVTVRCCAAGEHRLRIEVSDTGIGIPAARRAEVFQPFSRLGVQSTEIEGTGIGLTITKQLVELMEGAIGFTSTPGEGSTFWIELPLAEAGQAADKAADSHVLAPAFGGDEQRRRGYTVF